MKVFRFFLPLVLSDLISWGSDEIASQEKLMIVFHKAVFLLFQKSRNEAGCLKKYKVLEETLKFLKETEKDQRWSEENLLLGEIKLGNFSAKLADEIIIGKPFCEEEFELFVKSVGRFKMREATKILNDYAVIFAAKCDARRLKFVLQEGSRGLFLFPYFH